MPACNNPDQEILRRQKIRVAHTGRKRAPISEETREKMRISGKIKIFTEDHKKHLGESNKGRIPWNKGMKCPHSEETKRKIGDGNKGKVRSKETREKLRNINTGKHPTQESINKRILKVIGCKRSEETKRKMSIASKGRKKSEETLKKISETKIQNGSAVGCKNPNWRGGTSFLPYCYKFNKCRRKATRNYYDNVCICCGKHVTENLVNNKTQWEMDVHHVDHDKEQGCGGRSFNLVILCHSCHAKEQHHRKEYQDYINKTLREGFKWGIWSEQEYIEKVMYAD